MAIIPLPGRSPSTFMYYGAYVRSQVKKVDPEIYEVATNIACDYEDNETTDVIRTKDTIFLSIILPFFFRNVYRILILTNTKQVQSRFEESENGVPDIIARDIIHKSDEMPIIAKNAFITTRGKVQGCNQPERVVAPYNQAQKALSLWSEYDIILMIDPPKTFDTSVVNGYRQICLLSK